MRRKTKAAAVLGASAAALAAAAPGGAGAATNYGRVQVSTGHGGVAAALGFHCFPNADGTNGKCVNAEYPLDAPGRLAIRPGGRVRVYTGAAAISVQVRLVRIVRGKERVLDKDDAKLLGKGRRLWQYRVPRRQRVRGVRAVGVSVLYHDKVAFGDFEVGARAAKASRSARRARHRRHHHRRHHRR